MDWILQLVCWISIAGVVHSYVLYPYLLKLLWWLRGTKVDKPADVPGTWPQVSVLMSVYNEEAVIDEKLENLAALDYPVEQLRIYIGSDASSDTTNAIIADKNLPNLVFFPFEQRRGKPSVLNDLVRAIQGGQPCSPEHLLLITDANVMLAPDTLQRLARHFSDPHIGLVDTHMHPTGMRAAGISRSERYYISKEVWIKHLEGQLWGTMIGPFGGCFAMRANLFEPIPPNYLVDDFYLAMQVFSKGKKAINDLDAHAFEAVSHSIKEEYRRKARISAGNFQNLRHFRRLWWPPTSPLAFAFFSHKVLRWWGPFLILLAWSSTAILALLGNQLYGWLFLLITLGLLLPILIDILFNYLKINWLFLRSLRYFSLMNLALLKGYWRFRKGIQKGSWEPPKRT